MLLSNWNWSTLEVFGEEGRVEVRGRGREGKERRGGGEGRWEEEIGEEEGREGRRGEH